LRSCRRTCPAGWCCVAFPRALPSTGLCNPISARYPGSIEASEDLQPLTPPFKRPRTRLHNRGAAARAVWADTPVAAHSDLKIRSRQGEAAQRLAGMLPSWKRGLPLLALALALLAPCRPAAAAVASQMTQAAKRWGCAQNTTPPPPATRHPPPIACQPVGHHRGWSGGLLLAPQLGR